jgi:hypothetical protein
MFTFICEGYEDRQDLEVEMPSDKANPLNRKAGYYPAFYYDRQCSQVLSGR